ncbi:elongation factor P [Candidatus Collierbacteria bacterium]|nr:elongation factor P [Candidatus Collierbacteria bacterium]
MVTYIVMLSANELRNGTVFSYEDGPWKVTKFEHSFKGRGRGKVTVKARNLKTGTVREISYQSSEMVEEADVERRQLTYLYRTRDEAIFDGGDEGEQIAIPIDKVEWEIQFLTKKQEIWTLFFEEEPISIILPPTVELEVKETDPGVKGDTVSNTLKQAKMSTGLAVKVPLFINAGEKIIVSTEDGGYRSRA